MDMLELSIPSERLIGFTVPENGRFLVCGHDGVWQVIVGASASVEETDYAPYDIAERSDFVGWGRADSTPVLNSGRCTVSYAFDPRASSVQVQVACGDKIERIDFPTLSGDWFGASLSRDGDLLVLAEPYRIGLYRTAPNEC